jgi:hypothetical protein
VVTSSASVGRYGIVLLTALVRALSVPVVLKAVITKKYAPDTRLPTMQVASPGLLSVTEFGYTPLRRAPVHLEPREIGQRRAVGVLRRQLPTQRGRTAGGCLYGDIERGVPCNRPVDVVNVAQAGLFAPARRPVCVLNAAHAGKPEMLNVKVSLSASPAAA